MQSVVTTAIKEVIEAVRYRPAVSIIMPFEPKLGLKSALRHALHLAADKIERELQENYTAELEILIMHKLKAIIKNLNFDTHKKSIAIYVSPVFEKVLYLNIPVEEKVIVDESFEIRDLVYSKKQEQKYLLLHLSANSSRVYLGNKFNFIKILSNTIDSAQGMLIDIPERVGGFSNKQISTEIVLEKFLHYVDNTMHLILDAYRLPLIIIGTDEILSRFNKITKHNNSIIEFVKGDYDEATAVDLKEVLMPYIADWKTLMQKNIIHYLKQAASNNKLVVGIKDVWREALAKKGKLLVIEKNFKVTAEIESCDEIIYKSIEPFNHFSYIKDVLDDIIEKVLENGGDVELVDVGVLKNFSPIALIQY